MLLDLPPTFKHVLRQIRFLQLLEYWLLRGSHAILGFTSLSAKQVAVGRLNGQHVQILLQTIAAFSSFCNNLQQPATIWFVAKQVWIWVVKRATCFSTRFAAMLQNKLHVSVARGLVALAWVTQQYLCSFKVLHHSYPVSSSYYERSAGRPSGNW